MIINLNNKLKLKMRQNIKNTANIEIPSNDANKNEEDLLAFSSQYKSTTLKDEEIKGNEDDFRAKRKKSSQDSTSFSISQEHNNLSGVGKKDSIIIQDESFGFNESKTKFQDRQRKMSSPLCCYYYGSDSFLSKIHKKIIDLKNSHNYVKKVNYYNDSSMSIKHLDKNSKKLNNDNLNYKINYQNNNCSINDNGNINPLGQKTKRLLSFNGNQMAFNYNTIHQQNINNLIYQQQLFNYNYLKNLGNNNVQNNRKLSFNYEEGIIVNSFNNILQLNYNPFLFSYNNGKEENCQMNINRNMSNKSIPNLKEKKEKKPFDKRKGDWNCPDCHNLNFAFRVICNRCQQPKPNDQNVKNEQ